MNNLKTFSWTLVFIWLCLSCREEEAEPTLFLSLNPKELILNAGETKTLSAVTNSTQIVIWSSSDISVATVESSDRTNAHVTGKNAGTAIITVSIDNGLSYTCLVTISDPFTDTGVIINGVKWATRNVDAPGTFTATSESVGMLYQWNRKVGWSSNNPLYPSDNVSSWRDTRTNNDAIYWEEENDPCPCGWRVPNQRELESLANIRGTWSNSPAGYYFGSPPNTLFLPAAGYRMDTDGMLLRKGSQGNYWCAESAMPFASGLNFGDNGSYLNYPYPASGLSVRCVAIE